MNIAIPKFGTRVSPRFDTAPSVLLVRANSGSVEERTELSLTQLGSWRRAGLLSGHEIDVLLCGGIRQCDYFSIVSQGIEVYPGLIGEVEDVLEVFLQGGLSKDGFCGGLIPVSPRRQRRGIGRGSTRQTGRRGAGRRRMGGSGKTPGN